MFRRLLLLLLLLFLLLLLLFLLLLLLLRPPNIGLRPPVALVLPLPFHFTLFASFLFFLFPPLILPFLKTLPPALILPYHLLPLEPFLGSGPEGDDVL